MILDGEVSLARAAAARALRKIAINGSIERTKAA
jgi:hypothetical protein